MENTDRQRMLDHLRQQGELQIKGLWQQAEEQLRLEEEALAKELATAYQQVEEQNSRELEQLQRISLLQARKEAGIMRTTAQEAFAQRLWDRALALLPRLVEEEDEGLLARLHQELPSFPWARVTIRSRDHEPAQALFPDAEISHDPSVAGGFIVETAEGKIRIDNTVNRRLAMLWPNQLPSIMAEFREGAP